tara:strand:- start:1179 stop:1403 length:225 start_codon:yes stop_codon:yes gene_type:complete
VSGSTRKSTKSITIRVPERDTNATIIDTTIDTTNHHTRKEAAKRGKGEIGGNGITANLVEGKNFYHQFFHWRNQ